MVWTHLRPTLARQSGSGLVVRDQLALVRKGVGIDYSVWAQGIHVPPLAPDLQGPRRPFRQPAPLPLLVSGRCLSTHANGRGLRTGKTPGLLPRVLPRQYVRNCQWPKGPSPRHSQGRAAADGPAHRPRASEPRLRCRLHRTSSSRWEPNRYFRAYTTANYLLSTTGYHTETPNIVERGTRWLKQCRQLVTHFEKTASIYPRIAPFVSVRHWLQNTFAANVHMP